MKTHLQRECTIRISFPKQNNIIDLPLCIQLASLPTLFLEDGDQPETQELIDWRFKDFKDEKKEQVDDEYGSEGSFDGDYGSEEEE